MIPSVAAYALHNTCAQLPAELNATDPLSRKPPSILAVGVLHVTPLLLLHIKWTCWSLVLRIATSLPNGSTAIVGACAHVNPSGPRLVRTVPVCLVNVGVLMPTICRLEGEQARSAEDDGDVGAV